MNNDPPFDILCILYISCIFNIYVEMCLFDVVVALDVKKIEKKCLFLYFLMRNDICRYFSIFSPLLPISFISDPRRYIRRHDICNFAPSPFTCNGVLTFQIYDSAINYCPHIDCSSTLVY